MSEQTKARTLTAARRAVDRAGLSMMLAAVEAEALNEAARARRGGDTKRHALLMAASGLLTAAGYAVDGLPLGAEDSAAAALSWLERRKK